MKPFRTNSVRDIGPYKKKSDLIWELEKKMYTPKVKARHWHVGMKIIVVAVLTSLYFNKGEQN